MLFVFHFGKRGTILQMSYLRWSHSCVTLARSFAHSSTKKTIIIIHLFFLYAVLMSFLWQWTHRFSLYKHYGLMNILSYMISKSLDISAYGNFSRKQWSFPMLRRRMAIYTPVISTLYTAYNQGRHYRRASRGIAPSAMPAKMSYLTKLLYLSHAFYSV